MRLLASNAGFSSQLNVCDAAGALQGHTLVKPAHIPGQQALGLKLVSVFPQNAKVGLPTVPGTIIVIDDSTGLLKGIVDGTFVTALRTAAGSGCATRALAKPAASRLVVFGSGAQAAAHIEAMLHVRPSIDCVTVVSKEREHAEKLCASLSPCAPSSSWQAVAAGDTPTLQACVETADIICTCTSSPTPLFDGAWLSAGVHINAVGSYRRDAAELDAVTMNRARVIVDTAAAAECGELAAPTFDYDKQVVSTLGQLLKGDVCGTPGTAGVRRGHAGIRETLSCESVFMYLHRISQFSSLLALPFRM